MAKKWRVPCSQAKPEKEAQAVLSHPTQLRQSSWKAHLETGSRVCVDGPGTSRNHHSAHLSLTW